MEFETIVVERPEPRIARIVMNRPEARNAQNLQMTYDLNAAFDAAVQDDAVKVIIWPAAGRIFRPGTTCARRSRTPPAWIFRRSEIGAALPSPTPMAALRREQEIYLQITRRWRNLAKPTIAEVHGKCIAGGLMLAWACDLIVASDEPSSAIPWSPWASAASNGSCIPGSSARARPRNCCSPPTPGAPTRRTGSAWSITLCPRPELSSFVMEAGREDRGKTVVRAEADQGGGQSLGRT
jgi:enoyl-CoA hydratase